MSEEIKLKREVEAVAIPAGTTRKLAAGTEVIITQDLGGTFTVHTPHEGPQRRRHRHPAGTVRHRLPETFARLQSPPAIHRSGLPVPGQLQLDVLFPENAGSRNRLRHLVRGGYRPHRCGGRPRFRRKHHPLQDPRPPDDRRRNFPATHGIHTSLTAGEGLV